jgi:hypothetical protein
MSNKDVLDGIFALSEKLEETSSVIYDMAKILDGYYKDKNKEQTKEILEVIQYQISQCENDIMFELLKISISTTQKSSAINKELLKIQKQLKAKK